MKWAGTKEVLHALSSQVEWENEDGGSEIAELGQVETGSYLTESDVGLKLAAAQEIIARLQSVVTTQQLQQHCQAARYCSYYQAPRNVKDYRTRTLDTALGRLVVDAPRFDNCRACGKRGCCRL